MANTTSAKKAQRQNERRAVRNRSAMSAIRTYEKKALSAVAVGSSGDVSAVVRQAVSALNSAARKGVIHPNNAARRTSRLMSRLHVATVTPVVVVQTEKPVRATRAKAKAAPRTRTRTAKA